MRRDDIRIVHSLWTKPVEKRGHFSLTDRALGGWSDKKYYYMSWALSCLRACSLYERVELVTDTRGKALLIDCLQLPYTRVQVALDELDEYDPDLWALGKIYAYALQDEPFIHIDGDVFLWEPLPEELARAPLVAQHEERAYSFYRDNLRAAAEAGIDMPAVIAAEIAENRPVVASNAGILGGTNVRFFKDFKKAVILFLQANKHKLRPGLAGGLNNIFEQYLFWCLAQQQQIPIAYLLENISYHYEGLCDFHNVPHKRGFIHVVGINKRKARFGEDVALRLRLEWPGVYDRIQELLNHNLI